MPRTIRERPRYALLLGLGLACLVALGVLVGLLLAGGDDSAMPARIHARAPRHAMRAARAEPEDARAELETLQGDVEAAGDAAARQRVRAAAWRRRAQRSQALHREQTGATGRLARPQTTATRSRRCRSSASRATTWVRQDEVIQAPH